MVNAIESIASSLASTLIVLLIEDEDERWGDKYQNAYESPPSEWSAVAHVPSFRTIRARSGERARQILAEFRANGMKIDLVHLDLKLPELEADVGKDDRAFVAVGRGLLDDLKPDVCSAVVIVSDFKDFDSAREALHMDIVADYIPKIKVLSHFEEVYHTLVKAYQNVRKNLEIEWLKLCRERDHRWHFAQTFAQLVDRMALTVTDSISGLQARLAELRGLLKARYRLDPLRDRDDHICLCLRAIEEDALGIAQRCGRFRTETAPSNYDEPRPVKLRAAVEHLRQRLAPAFEYHCVRFEIDLEQAEHLEVTTYETEFAQILEELVFNALEATAANPAAHERRVRLSVESSGPGAATGLGLELRVEDHGKPMEQKLADRITQGDFLDTASGRVQGLALAQRLAHGSVGHVEAQPTDVGNWLTIQMPEPSHG